MSGTTEVGMDGSTDKGDQGAEARAVGEREVRWSARRKEGVVMRLMRGESLDALSREVGQPAGRISRWRDEFLAAGREGLKARPKSEPDRRLADAQRKVGELTLDNEILKGLLGEVEHRPHRPRR